MSLLMEALRKAEQVKKQAAGIDRTPEPIIRETSPDEQSTPGPNPSMERDENTGLDLDLSRNTVLKTASENEGRARKTELEDTNVSLDLWKHQEGITDSTQRESSPSFDLHLEEKSASGTQSGRITAMLAEKAVPISMGTAPEVQPESLPPVVPSIAAPNASAETSRQAARAVFVAKSNHQRLARTRRLLFIGIAAGLALFGAGGYLFFSYKTMTNFNAPIAPANKVAMPSEPIKAPLETPTFESAKPSTSLPTAPKETPRVGNNAGLPEQKLASDRIAAPAFTENTLTRPAPTPLQHLDAVPQSTGVPTPSSSPMGTAASGSKSGQDLSAPQREPEILPLPERPRPSQPAIKITHRGSQPQTDPLLTTAYTAYQQGNFEQSRQNYQIILRADPEHRGAMLGLAAVALRLRESGLARDLYLRLLERDPSDPLAKVGLMTVMPKDDSVRMESELKLLLEVHPNSAPLSFFLGNVYAAGQRWNEAQQSYFNALQAVSKGASPQGAVSPDYPFNLAVSLEHLNKPDLAIRYYREAQKLATSLPAGFDKEVLRLKLENLNWVEKQ